MIAFGKLSMVQPLRATNVSGKKKIQITVLYFVDKCENTILVLLNLLEHV